MATAPRQKTSPREEFETLMEKNFDQAAGTMPKEEFDQAHAKAMAIADQIRGSAAPRKKA